MIFPLQRAVAAGLYPASVVLPLCDNRCELVMCWICHAALSSIPYRFLIQTPHGCLSLKKLAWTWVSPRALAPTILSKANYWLPRTHSSHPSKSDLTNPQQFQVLLSMWNLLISLHTSASLFPFCSFILPNVQCLNLTLGSSKLAILMIYLLFPTPYKCFMFRICSESLVPLKIYDTNVPFFHNHAKKHTDNLCANSISW